jgi:hypothetical protein
MAGMLHLVSSAPQERGILVVPPGNWLRQICICLPEFARVGRDRFVLRSCFPIPFRLLWTYDTHGLGIHGQANVFFWDAGARQETWPQSRGVLGGTLGFDRFALSRVGEVLRCF